MSERLIVREEMATILFRALKVINPGKTTRPQVILNFPMTA